ncbi:hypothetical protein LTR66_006715 [Elasticomyces elasticus]|nr:hypothetical protein LTR66_006715 [Elasticomyces elasticus]
MVFLGIYRAIYDYVPHGDNELAISEGDLLFVLEKSTEDDWWKAKKKASDDEDDEPEGLIPKNYVDEAKPINKARALFDYARQTDEELSFTEDATLDVYDTSDPDWTLVGLNGEYGFAPANYIEEASGAVQSASATRAQQYTTTSIDNYLPGESTPSPVASPVHNPAATLAGIIAQRTGQTSSSAERGLASPPLPQRPQYTPEESDEEIPAPSLPHRPVSQQLPSPTTTQYANTRSPEPTGLLPSPMYNQSPRNDYNEQDALRSPGGFHMYNIHEMVSHMGKNKKMPTTLGINVAKGVIMISPEKSRDGPSKEWTAEKLTHYSIEGKHVFLELVRPSKSVDFHAGAKDTAQEIVSALGELAGAARAGGLREVLAASAGSSAGMQKKGQMLYEFMAQGDDEVTVAVGDEVIVLDDTKSDEWWMVRRLRSGKEGVVPSSYVEITGMVPAAPSSITGLNAARSTVEQNRLEEERLARQATKSHRRRDSGSKSGEVGPGMQLPERNSSLSKELETVRSSRSKREKSDSKGSGSQKPRRYHLGNGLRGTDSVAPAPNPAKVRTWTDRSGTFTVEAEFIGLRDEKIHLHKVNGVKIAVPISKMSVENLEYIERTTKVSLDEYKPLSEIKRRSTQKAKDQSSRSAAAQAGASIGKSQKTEYDWFDFFLQCGVNPQICERYASAFNRDQMGEEVLPDVEPQLLRTLGLKEGDILRVMKFLDKKYGRTATKDTRKVGFDTLTNDNNDPDRIEPVTNGSTGGLFSGPGGTLRNNTRKGRPAPAVQTTDVVDPYAFKAKTEDTASKAPSAEATTTPLTSAQISSRPTASGFDDDAWDVKPSKSTPAPGPALVPALVAKPHEPQQAPQPAGALSELSLLSPPLQPTPAPQLTPTVQAPAAAPQQTLRTGADPSFFDKLAAPAPQQQLQPQGTGFNQMQPLQPQQTAAPRQRPQAPQQMQSGGSLGIPPPPRAASAPGYPQQNSFGPPPLQPQLTGYQNHSNMQPIAPQGQSLQELSQQRFQQQQQQQQFSQQQMQPQSTGFQQPQPTGFNQYQNGVLPQQTGFSQFQPQQQQPNFQHFQPQQTGYQPPIQQQFINGQQNSSPFADPPRPLFQSRPSGLQQSFSQLPMQPQQTGFVQPQATGLPPPLQPLRTGVNGFGQQPQQMGYAQAPQMPPMPPMPPMPQLQPTLQPLVAQKTGPAPPVRFGVQAAANKLVAQPTGRRANLSQATPQNPFGF